MLAAWVRALGITLTLGLACSTLSGCSTASARRDPNTLVVLYTADANTINPLFANNEPAFLYYDMVFEGLTNTVGPDFHVVPWLATGWKSSPDHLHWRVDLRHGVHWSDGAPFDSRDVVFTWKTMLDPNVGFPYAGQFTYVKHVVALGRYSVRFDLSAQNVLFLSEALASPVLPDHILGKIAPASLRLSSFGQHPIGTGAYVLSSWHHDESALFSRNLHWWRGMPKIPRVQFEIVLDGDARVDAMADGSADFYLSMTPADYRTLRSEAPKLSYISVPDLFERWIQVNLQTPGLDDVAVRQAMLYGWDRRAVVEGLYHGDVILNNSFEPTALEKWHDAHLRPYAYDPRTAEAMLDAAGWKRGSDGIRRRGRVRLAFALNEQTGNSQLANVGTEFQSDMRAIGVDISIQVLDYATFIDRDSTLHYQLALTGWGGSFDPDDYTFLDSSQIPPVGNNYTGYRNVRVDHDMVAALKAFDEAKRQAIYDDAQRIVNETLPVLPGFDERSDSAYSRRVHLDRALMLPDYELFWNVWDWSLSD